MLTQTNPSEPANSSSSTDHTTNECIKVWRQYYIHPTTPNQHNKTEDHATNELQLQHWIRSRRNRALRQMQLASIKKGANMESKIPWSGTAWAMPTSIRYFVGCLASSVMGMTLVLFLAMLTRSLPLRWENSTAYTNPVCKVTRLR